MASPIFQLLLTDSDSAGCNYATETSLLVWMLQQGEAFCRLQQGMKLCCLPSCDASNCDASYCCNSSWWCWWFPRPFWMWLGWPRNLAWSDDPIFKISPLRRYTADICAPWSVCWTLMVWAPLLEMRCLGKTSTMWRLMAWHDPESLWPSVQKTMGEVPHVTCIDEFFGVISMGVWYSVWVKLWRFFKKGEGRKMGSHGIPENSQDWMIWRISFSFISCIFTFQKLGFRARKHRSCHCFSVVCAKKWVALSTWKRQVL